MSVNDDEKNAAHGSSFVISAYTSSQDAPTSSSRSSRRSSSKRRTQVCPCGDVIIVRAMQLESNRQAWGESTTSLEPLFAWCGFAGCVIDGISGHGGILGRAGGRTIAFGGMLGRANGRMVACGGIGGKTSSRTSAL